MLHVLCTTKRMNFRDCLPQTTKWTLAEGPWEFRVIHKGRAPLGSLNAPHIQQCLQRLTRKNHAAPEHGTFVFTSPPNPKKEVLEIEKFWTQWEVLAAERKAITSKRRINYKLLDDNLRKTNLLLYDCPCPWLARVARLAKIPLGRSLRIPGILIYAIIGRFPPYVGQLGAKTWQHARDPSDLPALATVARQVVTQLCDHPTVHAPFPYLKVCHPVF